MWAADRFVPLLDVNNWLIEQIGIGLLIAGFGVAGLAAFHMRKHEAAIHPHDEPTNLVTNGIFKWSRNPIYLGMVISTVGWACYLGTLTPLLGPPLFAIWIDRRFIRPEERRLVAKFDGRFRRYMATTRRWI